MAAPVRTLARKLDALTAALTPPARPEDADTLTDEQRAARAAAFAALLCHGEPSEDAPPPDLTPEELAARQAARRAERIRVNDEVMPAKQREYQGLLDGLAADMQRAAIRSRLMEILE